MIREGGLYILIKRWSIYHNISQMMSKVLSGCCLSHCIRHCLGPVLGVVRDAVQSTDHWSCLLIVPADRTCWSYLLIVTEIADRRRNPEILIWTDLPATFKYAFGIVGCFMLIIYEVPFSRMRMSVLSSSLVGPINWFQSVGYLLSNQILYMQTHWHFSLSVLA